MDEDRTRCRQRGSGSMRSCDVTSGNSDRVNPLRMDGPYPNIDSCFFHGERRRCGPGRAAGCRGLCCGATSAVRGSPFDHGTDAASPLARRCRGAGCQVGQSFFRRVESPTRRRIAALASRATGGARADRCPHGQRYIEKPGVLRSPASATRGGGRRGRRRGGGGGLRRGWRGGSRS